jgi:ATP-dependent helicase/DNAse subunit B
LLGALAAEAGLARTPRGPGRVRVLSADLIRTLDVPYLYVMGLGERSFPRLGAPEPFFDDGERQSFRQAGIDFTCAGDRMPDELLLFYQVVTRATRRLTLSYPAVDDRGQALLPSSFLNSVLDCFTLDSVPVERRRMMIERYEQDRPFCPAELRVRVAAALARGESAEAGLTPALAANLADAARLAQHRFRDPEFGPFNGLLRDPVTVDQIAQLFGPEKVFSPTALEEYVACPYRFFADHVLKLEPLEEPSEEIESTDRGLVFHRALSRLHSQLRASGIDQPSDVIDEMLSERLAHAVKELAVHASPAGAVLWDLEGRRLQKRGARYRRDWRAFLDQWREIDVLPKPAHFEKGFGLPAEPGEEMAGPLVIQSNGIEVRIGGRIDRVDVAQSNGHMLFCIIDYKTGRSSNYSGSSLKSFERLQLTLYALAVERVLLAEQRGRPLGLAYWLVTDNGAKLVLPGHPRHHAWFADPERWPVVRQLLETTVASLVKNIRAGAFPLQPRSEDCTATCSFAQICRITQSRNLDRKWSLPLPTIP